LNNSIDAIVFQGQVAMDFRVGFFLLVVFTFRGLGGVIPFHACNVQCGECNNQSTTIDLKCGSDGVVYLNECELNCSREHCDPSMDFHAKCKVRHTTLNLIFIVNCFSYLKALKLEHAGVCTEVKPHGSQPDRTPELQGSTPTMIPGSICDPFEDCDCTYDLLLLCGTDRETYPNECVLKCGTKCNKSKPIYDSIKFQQSFILFVVFFLIIFPNCFSDLKISHYGVCQSY